MAFENGSLVLVDYTGRTKDGGEVVDTTRAEDAGYAHGGRAAYQPKLVSIGDVSYPVLPGLAEALAGASAGEKLTVEVPPDRAFGERDPGKVRMVPTRKLGDDAERVSVGDPIEMDGKRGVIRYIGSGRVQIDYNHKHAGKTIMYDAEVVKSLETPSDRITEILKSRLSLTTEQVELELTDTEATVRVPRVIFRADGIQNKKNLVQIDVFKFVPALEKLSFVETHKNTSIKKPAPEAPPAQPPAAGGPAAERPAAGGPPPEGAPPAGP